MQDASEHGGRLMLKNIRRDLNLHDTDWPSKRLLVPFQSTGHFLPRSLDTEAAGLLPESLKLSLPYTEQKGLCSLPQLPQEPSTRACPPPSRGIFVYPLKSQKTH